jgi:hypothetical protein
MTSPFFPGLLVCGISPMPADMALTLIGQCHIRAAAHDLDVLD